MAILLYICIYVIVIPGDVRRSGMPVFDKKEVYLMNILEIVAIATIVSTLFIVAGELYEWRLRCGKKRERQDK